MSEYKKKRVLVTGTSGFLGTHLVKYLTGKGAEVYGVYHERAATSNCYWLKADLRKYTDVASLFLSCGKLDYVFHCAGWNGGINFNLKNPARILHDNTVMAMNMLEASERYKVGKFIGIVASCAYPDAVFYPDDFHDDTESRNLSVLQGVLCEADFFRGRPHPSVACHGYAKRNLQLGCKMYSEQYGLNAVCVCPTTLFGPGDLYDPDRTKVLGGMVKRFVDAEEAKAPFVECWGTGKALREFLYVEDATKLITKAGVAYTDSEIPLNLGSGQEISIRGLAMTVATTAGYEGEIRWDASKGDGQLRKRLDLTRMKETLGNFEFTPFPIAVTKTVNSYKGLE